MQAIEKEVGLQQSRLSRILTRGYVSAPNVLDTIKDIGCNVEISLRPTYDRDLNKLIRPRQSKEPEASPPPMTF